MHPYPGPNCALLLDNCAIHLVFELEEILNAMGTTSLPIVQLLTIVFSGCVLIRLPAYSPDFNPIEKMFHQGTIS